jgi:hypothetical protein
MRVMLVLRLRLTLIRSLRVAKVVSLSPHLHILRGSLGLGLVLRESPRSKVGPTLVPSVHLHFPAVHLAR